MEWLRMNKDGEKARGADNGDYWACNRGRARHRRSKSASDRKVDRSESGGLHSINTDSYESPELTLPAKTSTTQSPFREHTSNASVGPMSSSRASLEEDIVQLQLRLQQERSVRMFLERAMGRASSTLSPGHRHFATQELIAEIELLEEEVANREQHVLSLYRNIFDQCISQPPSGQSSSIVSPAHVKNEPRKHPSIISSAFCSSKTFPLRTFQALATINGSTKRSMSVQSRTRHASLLGDKCSTHFDKVNDQVLGTEKNSTSRTLKDHLYQCPSKLSEEMVSCMASVYCWLGGTAPSKLEHNQSPKLLRSSTHVKQPCPGTGEDRDELCKSVVEISCLSTDKKNNYHASYAINNYRVLVEQLEKVDVNQMDADAQTAFWINLYNSLVMHVKTSRWYIGWLLNLFSSNLYCFDIFYLYLAQAYLAYGIPHSSLRRLALFHKAAYNIGGHIISANAIEQSIFCFRTPRIGWWLETFLSTVMMKRPEEERQRINSKFGLRNSGPSEPLIFFTLCTGAISDPILRVYTASNIKEQLEVAKKEFLQSNVITKKSKKVYLPRLLQRFAKEASIPTEDLLGWVDENVDKRLNDSIRRCIDGRANKKATQIIEWLPYSSRFAYMLSKDAPEKTWWV